MHAAPGWHKAAWAGAPQHACAQGGCCAQEPDAPMLDGRPRHWACRPTRCQAVVGILAEEGSLLLARRSFIPPPIHETVLPRKSWACLCALLEVSAYLQTKVDHLARQHARRRGAVTRRIVGAARHLPQNRIAEWVSRLADVKYICQDHQGQPRAGSQLLSTTTRNSQPDQCASDTNQCSITGCCCSRRWVFKQAHAARVVDP